MNGTLRETFTSVLVSQTLYTVSQVALYWNNLYPSCPPPPRILMLVPPLDKTSDFSWIVTVDFMWRLYTLGSFLNSAMLTSKFIRPNIKSILLQASMLSDQLSYGVTSGGGGGGQGGRVPPWPLTFFTEKFLLTYKYKEERENGEEKKENFKGKRWKIENGSGKVWKWSEDIFHAGKIYFEKYCSYATAACLSVFNNASAIILTSLLLHLAMYRPRCRSPVPHVNINVAEIQDNDRTWNVNHKPKSTANVCLQNSHRDANLPYLIGRLPIL